MAREALALTLAAAFALAGCVANATSITPGDADLAASGFTAGPALWDDPQNAPHPAWNWPTLAHPVAQANAPAHWAPVPAAPAPADVAGMEHVKRVSGNIRGAGIAAFGNIVVVPGFSADTHIVDVSDPTNPVVVSDIPGRHRGAAVIAYPDGRLVSVFATNAHLEFWDITDPADPWLSDMVQPRGGSHKVGVVPGTPIVYNANTDGQGSVMSIFDATDPENVTLVQDFNGGTGCHHVYFWITPAKQRSICAGVEFTQILDIADPRNPEIVVNVPVHHGIPGTPSTAVSIVRFSHFAILSQDGDTLIVGDETGGGAAPACDAHVEVLGKSVSGPLGNVYFYDISDETNPVLMSWFNPGAHFTKQLSFGSCTAHHGRIVPDPNGERDLLVMGFYAAGTVLIDYTDVENPSLLAQHARGTTWEAWYNNGWIVTGDLSRGLDVLKLI